MEPSGTSLGAFWMPLGTLGDPSAGPESKGEMPVRSKERIGVVLLDFKAVIV